MIRPSQIALHVRVKLNNNFKPKCLGEEHLIKDSIIVIADKHIYNDIKGEYVHLRGYTKPKDRKGVFINSGYAYLDQIDLEFPWDFDN